MIKRIWRLFVGYIVVTVKGRRVESFLNRMSDAGIVVWDVERLSTGMLVARMEASAFKRARALCRGRGWQIAIADRVGVPFWLTRLLRRKALLAGAVMALACLYIASGYIWFVHVEGADGPLADQVIHVAEQAGLKRKVRIDGLNPKDIQLELLLNIPELSWAALNIQGTRAVIEVAERTAFDATLARPGDVIAERDGIIERIAVSQGYPLVREGDTVRRGDIMISGFIPPDDPRHRQMLREGKSPYVRADGVVWARVWYEGTSRVRLVAQQSEPTGRRSWLLRLALNERQIIIGKGAAPFQDYEEEVWNWEFSLLSWPVQIVFGRYLESQVNHWAVDEEEATQRAVDIALADLQSRLPEEAEILDGPIVDVAVVDGTLGPIVEVRVRAELMDDIRAFRMYP